MLSQLELYKDQKTLDLILSPMISGTDKSEKIDWPTFVAGIESVVAQHYDPSNLAVHLPDVPLKKLQEKQMKVGFGGTTWRTAANANWILTNCGVRLASLSAVHQGGSAAHLLLYVCARDRSSEFVDLLWARSSTFDSCLCR